MATENDFIIVEVKNWNKYQMRKNSLKYSSWFRLEHSIIDDHKFFNLSPPEMWCFVYILSLCSRENKNVVTVNMQHADRVCRIEPALLHRALKKLKLIQVVELRSTRGRYVDVSQKRPTIQNNTEHNSTIHDRTGCERSQIHADTTAVVLESFKIIEIDLQKRSVKKEVQQRWLDAFPDAAWIVGEVRKALAWEDANPTRRKKNFGAFITRWLTKGWDYRKTNKTDFNWDEFWKEKEDKNVQP